MKKKIKPAEQTKELNRAKWELLKRNEDELKKFKELLDKNEKKRDELSTYLASFFTGEVDPKSKEAWDFLLKNGLDAVDKDLTEYLQKEEISPAVKSVWNSLNYIMDLHNRAVSDEQDPSNMGDGELKKKIIEMYCMEAKQIFNELTNRNPFSHLLLGIDLTRSKEVIIEEVREIITDYQAKLGVNELKKARLKWLPKVDELLEVWDLYDQAGQKPTVMTFKIISKKVGRPLSTVKSQWYKAYEMIFGEVYDPEIKYTTEEKKTEATKLCAECPHDAKCYRRGDWSPCADYLRIAGKERKTPNNLEFKDEIYK